MARDFDNFPTYDPVINAGTDKLSSIWADFMATFVETLVGYLSQHGVFIPEITTTQRNAIQSPVNGQMIYNITTGTFQGFIAGAWKTFTLT